MNNVYWYIVWFRKLTVNKDGQHDSRRVSLCEGTRQIHFSPNMVSVILGRYYHVTFVQVFLISVFLFSYLML